MKALVKSFFLRTYFRRQTILLILLFIMLLSACNTSSLKEKEYKLNQYTVSFISGLDESIKIDFQTNSQDYDSFTSALCKIESKVTITKNAGDSKLVLSDTGKSLEVELPETNLEYALIKYLKLLLQPIPIDIAFIEGHDELLQVELLDAEGLLAQEYNVHRGEIGDRVGSLDGFAAIIIAGPKKGFNEDEKYVLDQYVMQGGKILWLLDGVYLSEEHLKIKGWSASIKNETNLDDILHSYGARVKPQLIQDQQCSNIQLISEELDELITVPNIYSPLLDLSQMQNALTDNLSSLSLLFASPVDLTSSNPNIQKRVILHSSQNTSLVDTPERIDFSGGVIENPKEYFKSTQVPLGLILEGEFQSFYENSTKEGQLKKSEKNKMIIIGSSSIIRNGLQGQYDNTQVLPMGYNRTDDFLADNREFILNAVNWLIEEDDLWELKDSSKQRLLND